MPPERAARPPLASLTSIRIQIDGQEYTIQVERDARLRAAGRWTLNGQRVRLRVPPGASAADLSHMIEGIEAKLKRRRKRMPAQSDAALQARAEALNRRYFDGELRWNSIRWSGNMRRRLGSCTTGGPTDGDIRISAHIRDWPDYVVDYVIAHEICHRKHANHSPEFWAYLGRYPHTERARGFVEGFAYGQGISPDDAPDDAM